ncbi:helix-turn-helix domain-containing protein [Paraconexibacter sp. AEG42_29]|uniref:TetR/AcrR family transcriptional regulator n=1 Tax=Paraconexibacter sp. AEG42_29 TaxID=2997339 RepID=UPI00339D9748
MAPSAPAPARAAAPRRSQQERSDTTRSALLDAALDVLATEGYARATTSRVCERAGLSRGAHLHHFGTRDGLLSAAVEQLAAQLIELHLGSFPDDEQPDPGRGLDTLWDLYTGRLFVTGMEVIMAARTDPDLLLRLKPLERQLNVQSARLCRRLFRAHGTQDEFDELMLFVLAAVRGVAMLDTTNPTTAARRARRWRIVREHLLAVLSPA